MPPTRKRVRMAQSFRWFMPMAGMAYENVMGIASMN